MRLLWMVAWFAVFASAVSLVSRANSGALLQGTCQQASRSVPPQTLAQLLPRCSTIAVKALRLLPVAVREKAAVTLAGIVQLVILRALLLWHALPGFILMSLAGITEGRAARQNQQALVKIHSPMWFSLGLTGLGLLLVVVSLWLTSQVAVPPSLLQLFVFSICLFSFRNLMIHAPSQF